MGDIADRLQKIRAAVNEFKRTPGEVTIVAVAKRQPMEKIREAVAAGVTVVANNYAQEGEALMAQLGTDSVDWHFIGHIQSRKVKYLPAYDCVQSLDRLEVAKVLSDRLAFLNQRQLVLVEVNIGEEPQKSGVLPSALGGFLADLAKLPHLTLAGLMGMPPALDPAEKRRPYFAKLKQLFDAYRPTYRSFETLSMGTSDDYLVAVEEGSTMIRLGTVLLGARDLTPDHD